MFWMAKVPDNNSEVYDEGDRRLTLQPDAFSLSEAGYLLRYLAAEIIPHYVLLDILVILEYLFIGF